MLSPDQQIVSPGKAILQKLNHPLLASKNIEVDVLRIDLIHPVISGNKWFKLKYHIEEALQRNNKGILTFGGAWSNHLVATAFTCKQYGLSSTGIVRGEKPAQFSSTLLDAQYYGMDLKFVSRDKYFLREQELPQWQQAFPSYLLVPEGGKGKIGIKGAMEIASLFRIKEYSHIVCAVGTGTMMAGLINASDEVQTVVGISSLKVSNRVNNELELFFKNSTDKENHIILYDYHFGGYAKKSDELLAFMNKVYSLFSIPTDFVYTGKLAYAVHDLITKDFFPQNSRLCIIHSGGLQGNRSLREGMLEY
jgi:1-aminocyclopropane-1-carboxylate deaminase